MRVLYSSCLCSRATAEQYGQGLQSSAVQKFHWLIVSGLVANDIPITTISSLPLIKKLKRIKPEKEKGILFNYTRTINIPVLRHILMVFSSFWFTLKWIKQNPKDSIVICDVLNISISIGTLVASKICKNLCVGIVTDIPGLMVGTQTNSLGRIIVRVNQFFIGKFDKYVLLTKDMNDIVNFKKKPFLVMEGLVDINMQNIVHIKNNNRNIIYAGGLMKRYGLNTLIESFMKLDDKDITLTLYGSGDMVDQIKNEYIPKDNRIIYKGVVSNAVIIEEESKAMLMVNPRPTTEEFTKYSFPSKNMEYMVSGTPLMTTKLQGMPKEYYPYVFLIDDESVEGMYRLINTIINKSPQELNDFGYRARQFVLQTKNNVIQAKKILNFLKN